MKVLMIYITYANQLKQYYGKRCPNPPKAFLCSTCFSFHLRLYTFVVCILLIIFCTQSIMLIIIIVVIIIIIVIINNDHLLLWTWRRPNFPLPGCGTDGDLVKNSVTYLKIIFEVVFEVVFWSWYLNLVFGVNIKSLQLKLLMSPSRSLPHPHLSKIRINTKSWICLNKTADEQFSHLPRHRHWGLPAWTARLTNMWPFGKTRCCYKLQEMVLLWVQTVNNSNSNNNKIDYW